MSTSNRELENKPCTYGGILLYKTEDAQTQLECRFKQKTIWLNQVLMYQKDIRTINEHLKSIYNEGELNSAVTVQEFRMARQEGNRRAI